jgi:hypothetical protein
LRLAYIIQGHKNPAQIARLARRLQTEDSQVWWHVSAAKKGLDGQVRALLDQTHNVHEVPAQKMYWNSWTFVQGILASLRKVLASGYPFDYVVLMTGQDYRYHVIPAPWSGLGEIRFRTRPRVRPALPAGFRLWGGSGYWALSRRHAEQLMRIIAEHNELTRLFRYVAVPDEMFFHTILMSTRPENEFVNQPSSLIVWRNPPTPHPAILVASDLEMIVSSGYPFARKFDATTDEEILDLLDARAGEVSVALGGGATI